MTDTSIFNNNDTQDEDYDNPGEKTFADDNSESVLESLVGEGKKFKDIESLAKGKVLSDSFIEKLKDENRRMREEKAKLETEMQNKAQLEDFIRELKVRGKEMNNGNNQTDENPNNSKTVEVDYEAIVKKTMAEIEQRKHLENEQNAVTKVITTAQKVLGSNWKEELKKIGNEIGMDTETLDFWAKKSPDSVIKLITNKGTSSREKDFSVDSTINSSGLITRNDSGVRDYAYYQKIKAKDPNAFRNNRDIQIQMHRDAQKLGDKFFG